MAGVHIVKQGEYLSKIANDNGFLDYHTIWEHPNNSQLRQRRQNPNVLLPGDQVFIPDKQQRQVSCSTGKLHTFVVKKPTLKLRLVLEDIYEKPISNVRCALSVEEQAFQLTTDATGKIEQDIPFDAQGAVLVVRSDETPYQDAQIPIKIGDLDPVEEVSGQTARLNNLGYFPGDGTDEDAFLSAVEEFQCDHGLRVDGICGPLTQAKLKKVHGC